MRSSCKEKSSQILPTSLCLESIVESGFHWHGDVPLAHFKRLFNESLFKLAAHKPDKPPSVFVNCDLWQNQSGVFWLSLTTHGSILQTCQRCLEPVLVPLSLDESIALVLHGSQISTLHEDDDYIVLAESDTSILGLDAHTLVNDVQAANLPEQGVQTAQKQLDLFRLVEDELLLSLPASAKHDDCGIQLHTATQAPSTTKANPFAVLAQLKNKLD